jgi:hypothetical protein
MRLGAPQCPIQFRLLAPLATRCVPSRAAQHARPLSRGAAAPRAQELDLYEYGCAALIPQLLAQPSVPRLRSLTLVSELPRDGVDPGYEPFTPLWAAPWFSQLQELSLTAKRGFGRPGLGPLRAAPLLRRLVIVNEGGPPALSAADGRALAAMPLPMLRELQLWEVRPGVVPALAAALWLTGLESLEMWSGGLDGPFGGLSAAAGRALAAAPLASLKRLGLCNTEPAFMAACSAAPWPSRLTRLRLWCEGDPLGGGNAPHGSPYLALVPFTALVELSLCDNGIAPPSDGSQFAALVAAPWFDRLQLLAGVVQLPTGHARRL